MNSVTALRNSNGVTAKRNSNGVTALRYTDSAVTPLILRRALTLLLLLSSVTPLFAISSNAGTKAGAFLKIATDARGVALNSTMVSAAQASEGMRWNPAALAFTTSKEAAATHIQYYQDVTIENISYAQTFDDGGIGASLFYLNSGDLEGRDTNGLRTGDFSAYDVVAGVGYGKRIKSRDEIGMDVYLGGVLKLVHEKIADATYKHPAADLGLIVDPTDTLRAGVTARNLATSKADFPKEFAGGISYAMFPVLTTSLAVKYTDDAPIRFGLSGEYKMPQLENSVVRLGYQTHDELNNSLDSKISGLRSASLAGLTFGGGMEVRPPQFQTLNFAMDYTMAPFGALGISHTLTLKVRW